MINSEALADFVNAELQSAKIPGCSLVIVDRHGIISAGAPGRLDPAKLLKPLRINMPNEPGSKARFLKAFGLLIGAKPGTSA